MVEQQAQDDQRSGRQERAQAEGLRLLAARPLSVAELRQRLAGRGHQAEDVELAITRLTQLGYLDDAELARHYIVTRGQRLGHGQLRLIRELERRGVDRVTADEAWRRAVDDGEFDPQAILQREVRRHVERHGGVLDRRAYRRVYNALFRAGFEASQLAAELESHRRFNGPAADRTDGNDHEFP